MLQCTLIGWLPATIWAWVAISNAAAEKRHRQMMKPVAAWHGRPR